MRRKKWHFPKYTKIPEDNVARQQSKYESWNPVKVHSFSVNQDERDFEQGKI